MSNQSNFLNLLVYHLPSPHVPFHPSNATIRYISIGMSFVAISAKKIWLENFIGYKPTLSDYAVSFIYYLHRSISVDIKVNGLKYFNLRRSFSSYPYILESDSFVAAVKDSEPSVSTFLSTATFPGNNVCFMFFLST